MESALATLKTAYNEDNQGGRDEGRGKGLMQEAAWLRFDIGARGGIIRGTRQLGADGFHQHYAIQPAQLATDRLSA
jgi:hypothetical protein